MCEALDWYVLYLDNGKWEECGEGPWSSRADAVAFAEAEVGLPWQVVSSEDMETLDIGE